MNYKWLEDAFNAFQQETAQMHLESLTQMMLQLEYWAEENKLDLAEAHRRAKVQKQMFDAADCLIKDGFEPSQLSLILQHRIGV